MNSGDDVGRDRQVIESILGQSFDGKEWPADAMPPGTRVRVVKDPYHDGPWQNEFGATVDATIIPLRVRNDSARPGEREYSVVFDTPQFDADGDGPYRKAVIWDRYLRPL